ncbi:MAG: sugar ABC transporter substrate-binding protein [Anaerolineae bacterium]|nr:sugar ABC transporter substrate-binding protein [Anaerolineae bacterium]
MMWKKILLITILPVTIIVIQCQAKLWSSALGEIGDDAQAFEAEEVRVAVVPPGFTSPFHVAIKNGAVEAAGRLGWTVDVVAAEREGDFAGQVTVVEQEIQKGVSAIAVNPIDAKAIVTAVKRANQASVPVFMQNLITPVDGGAVVEYIGYDQWSGAAKLARYTCDLLDNRGEVFILTGIPGFHANRRTQGYKWGLEQWCPGVKVVGEQTAEWEREKAVNVATAALQQNPNIDVFYGNSDEMGIGACIAAQKLGRQVNQDVWCVSIDGNDVTLELIEKGQTTATLGVYPKMMGTIVIDQMAKVLNGQKVPYILETPSTVVDINNVVDYKSGKTWTEPAEGKPELDNGLPSGEFVE